MTTTSIFSMTKVKIKAQDEPSTDDLDSMPLIKRRRLLRLHKPYCSSSSSGDPPALPVGIAASTDRAPARVPQEWPGLPKGVKFDPSDEELMWHLLAKVGKGEAKPHPLISNFIISLSEDVEFGDFNPQKLPGVKQDGTASFFFHRTFKGFDSESQKCWMIHNGDFGDACWQKIDKIKPVIVDGIHHGYKKMMILYMGVKKGERPERTNWTMHQYHLGRGEVEGEFVASKIFYQQKSRQSDNNAHNLPLENVEAVVAKAEAVASSISLEHEIHEKNRHLNFISAEICDQALQYHETRGEETNSYTERKKQNNLDNHPRDELERGNIAHQVGLHSQQQVEGIVASGEPCQTKSYNMVNKKRSRSCKFDNARVSAEELEKHSEDCKKEVSSRLSDDHMGHLSDCISVREHDELYPIKTEFPDDICHADSTRESATKKIMSTSPFHSPDSVMSGSPFMVDQSPPNNQNTLDASYSLETKKTNHRLSHQTSVSEVKSSVVGEQHGCLTANPQPCSSAFSTLVHVKSETLEEGVVNCLSEPDAMKCGTGILGSSDKGFENSSCTTIWCSPEMTYNCQDNISLTCSKLEKETESTSLDKSAFHEKVNFDAADKLQKSTVANCQVKVKHEPLESDLLKQCNSFQAFNTLGAEVKGELLDELSSDLIDHIPLTQRIKMLLPGNVSNSDNDNSLKCSKRSAQPTTRCGSVNSTSAETSYLTVRRKRKKTATDSVEKALEEDAPGLFQVLLDKGITVEEIKLYGAMGDDEELETCSIDDNFEDLETVITKLFLERSSLLKFPIIRPIIGSKAVNYCLACLISLIEQTRYLRFRNNSVEWGWCRDLRSFIFVFEWHNRIVLERPEYGYATYFFELVDSLPVDWQIRRLVTAMKVTSFSRITLIENKSLLVGEDLSEGEARVLEGYGWTPNTGLGTLLNYCDRVFHDSSNSNERDISEWRTKIGRLLMDGRDGGRTVLSALPNKLLECIGGQDPPIKLEL